MAADNATSGSPWRVAYDLMRTIAFDEAQNAVGENADRSRDPRAYYLKLYRDCLDAVASHGVPTKG